MFSSPFEGHLRITSHQNSLFWMWEVLPAYELTHICHFWIFPPWMHQKNFEFIFICGNQIWRSVESCFVWAERCTHILVGWNYLCRPLPAPRCTKGQISCPTAGLLPLYDPLYLSSSPAGLDCLLETPPCSRNCAGRHIKPSGRGMIGCPILVELHYLNATHDAPWR